MLINADQMLATLVLNLNEGISNLYHYFTPSYHHVNTKAIRLSRSVLSIRYIGVALIELYFFSKAESISEILFLLPCILGSTDA